MGRDHLTVLWRAEILVSIHAPTWGATRADCWLSGLNRFQSTRPRGARRDALTSPTLVKSSFNPRAHVGRDLVYFLFVPLQRVSIHAPTWGATPARQQDLRGRAVSIHAPTWGATEAAGVVRGRARVSIHAPTWGATNHYIMSAPNPEFQSTRPRGARLSPHSFKDYIHVFQSTRPRGARLVDFVFSTLVSVFQSTRPRGARHS